MISRAKERRDVKFPECACGCPCVEYLGVCECEAICSHKFDLKNGAALDFGNNHIKTKEKR